MQKRTIIITMKLLKNKVVLGLSGGVDSTTAALLLKKEGYEVIGLYFDVFGDNEDGRAYAKKMAKELGIKLIEADASNSFNNIVIDNFCKSYMSGRTPNPCVLCNPNVKFKILLDSANAEGAYYIATGHYGEIYHNQESDKFFIKRNPNTSKDQSYMMHRLGQDVLSRLMLPLNKIKDKSITRSIAEENGMSNSNKKDSQEICFVDSEKESYIDFLKNSGYESEPGNFIDVDGNILGTHKGIANYTLGQRKGLGIALGKPAFVIDIDPEENTVTLGTNDDLFKTEVIASDVFFTETSSSKIPENLAKDPNVYGKIRYASKPSKATLVFLEDGRVKAVFEEAQRGPTPGQSMVFYKDDLVIGGGFIE